MSSPDTPPRRRGKHGKKASAVLSMPTLFRATELSYESSISKFATYLVEEKDTESGDEMLMKAIKNEKCVALTLRYLLEQLNTLEHPNLPRIHFNTFSDNYSYVVFAKPESNLQPISAMYDIIKHNEPLCKSIIYELCRTIVYTHAFGVVHRDLRANNVFIHVTQSERTKKKRLAQLLLIDFGATKALQSDEKLAIMEQGSGFVSHYVRKEHGQYPAPEILMDLRYDRQCDAWFLGILIYQILNGGAIPFIGSDDDEIQDNILHSSSNKFSLLREQLEHNHGGSASDEESEMNRWMEISDDLFDIINGLLTKDAKKRYSVDYVLWNEWIPCIQYEHIRALVIRYWLRSYRIAKHDAEDTIFTLISHFAAIANNIKQSAHSGQVHWHNNDQTVMHQFKVCNYNSSTSSYVKSDCYVTISSNIWCKQTDKPLTVEYVIDFAKYDVYFGIICSNEYKRDVSYYHFIGSDPHSLSLSVRYGKAWLNSNDVGDVKRNEYLKQNITKDDKTRAQKIHNIQQTTESTPHKHEEMFSGPPPLRNVNLCMRIDSMSRTLSFKINDVILDPLYFEFPGYVIPAFTLCHCMDQVTIKSLTYDDMPNLQIQNQ